MFQSLLSLEDEKIELVMTSVRGWCERHGLSIDSDAGRAAINAAVQAVGEDGPSGNLALAIDARLNAGALVRKAA